MYDISISKRTPMGSNSTSEQGYRGVGGCAKRPFLVTHQKLSQKMKSLQKVENVISDSSQEGHLLIWGRFPAKNGCQSLKFKFPAKPKVVLHVNFCQLARQDVLPEFKIDMQNSLNLWQICHFEGLGSIWWGFALSNLVLDWHFGAFWHIFEKSTF